MDVDGRKRATRGTPNYVNRIILDDVIDQAMEISTDMELSDIKVPKTFEEADPAQIYIQTGRAIYSKF